MIKKELSIFLLVGLSTVIVDYVFYQILSVLLLTTIDVAKALAFIFGTFFAYFANRFWTFRRKQTANYGILKFALLYSATLSANVSINSQLLDFFENTNHAVQISFLFATMMSATLNFLGMKFFVFKLITISEKT